MKISRITHWKQRLAHPRLTARLFPPLPEGPKVINSLPPARLVPREKTPLPVSRAHQPIPEESLLKTVLGCLGLAVLLILIYIFI